MQLVAAETEPVLPRQPPFEVKTRKVPFDNARYRLILIIDQQ